MAANTEEIVVKFRTEGGHEVEETFRRTAEAGEQFHQKVTKAGGALGDLRAKSEARIANNIGAIAQSFSSGASAADVFAGAVTRVSESFRGSLLFASAATVGLGLYETITKIGEAYIKLNDDVARLTRPQGASDFLSTDQIKKNLSDITDEINTIYKQEVQRTHSPLRRLPGQLGQIFAVVGTELNIGDEDRRNRLREAATRSIDQLTEKQIKQNSVQKEAITGSEVKAKLDAEEIQHNERLGELARSTAPVGANAQALSAAFRLLRTEQDRFDLEKRQILVESERGALSIQHAKELLDIQRSGLSTDQQKLAMLLKEVEYRERLVALAKTDEQKAAARTDLQRAIQQLPPELQLQPLPSETNEIAFQAGRTAFGQRAKIALESFRRNTQTGQMQEYAKELQQANRSYYQNIQDEWDIYNLTTYGRLNRKLGRNEVDPTKMLDAKVQAQIQAESDTSPTPTLLKEIRDILAKLSSG